MDNKLEGQDLTLTPENTAAFLLGGGGGMLDANTRQQLIHALTEADTPAVPDVPLLRWADIPVPPARRWAIQDWIPAGAVTLLTGPGGAGKSLLALQLAAAIAGGYRAECVDPEWLAGAVHCRLDLADSGIAVYATWEDDAGEVRVRLSGISGPAAPWLTPSADGLRIADCRGRGPLWAAPGRFQDSAPTALLHGLDAAIARLDTDPALIVLDSSAAIYADSENDRKAVRAFLAELDRRAAAMNAAVVLVAHPPKNAQHEFSGSTDWLAGVRAMIRLSEQPYGNGKAHKLESVKISYAQRPEPVRMEFDRRKGFRWQAVALWEGKPTANADTETETDYDGDDDEA